MSACRSFWIICIILSGFLTESRLVFQVKRRILVTGYKSFRHFTQNPAEMVAKALHQSCDERVCWEGWTLPVNREGAKQVADEISRRNFTIPWDAIIHLGLEDTSKGLKLEMMAMNVLASETGPGWNRDLPCGDHPIALNQDCLLPTTAPLNRVNLPTQSSKLEWSRDAGVYYCNEIYYRTLLAVRESRMDPLTPVLFIHLPDLEISSVQQNVQVIRHVGSMIV